MDPASAGQEWRGDELMAQIERFESDLRNKPVENLGRTSPYPRILPLRDVLKAREIRCAWQALKLRDAVGGEIFDPLPLSIAATKAAPVSTFIDR